MRLRFRFSLPLAITMIAWSLNYVALKLLYGNQHLTASEVAFLRYLVMYAALVVIALVNKESLRMPLRDFLPVWFFGFLSMGVYMIFFMEAMEYSGPAEGAILLNTSPILTLLIAGMIGLERLKAGSLGGAFLAFLGVVLVTIPGVGHASHKAIGYVLIEVAALIWACSIVTMKPLLGRYTPFRLMVLSMPGGFPALLAYWLIRDHGAMPIATITPLQWLEFGHVALLSGVMGFILFYRGVHEVGPGEAALWMYFIPPLTALLQWLITGVLLTPIQFAGLFVVLAGVALAQRFRVPTVVPAPPADAVM